MTHTFNRNLFPYLALAFGILALGFSAIFVRWAGAPGPVMALHRIGLATLVMAPLFAHRRTRTVRLRAAALVFPLLAALFTSFDHAVWNTAVLYTSAANATLLGNTAPLWVTLVAWGIFRERLAGLFWVGLALTLGGAAAVLGYDFLLHPSFGKGDLLAVAAAVFYAGYFVFTQLGRRELDTLTYAWVVNLFSTLILLGMSLVMGLPLVGYSTQTYLAFLGAALINQVGGYLAISYALGKLPASMVAPTMLGQPVVTALLAVPFLGERLRPVQLIGGLAVLAGIYLVHHSRRGEGIRAQAGSSGIPPVRASKANGRTRESEQHILERGDQGDQS